MKHFIVCINFVVFCFGFTVLASACSENAGFTEPKSDAEWKSFCEAPDYLAKVKEIKDKEQRERVTGICLRAPWQKFTPSKPRQFF